MPGLIERLPEVDGLLPQEADLVETTIGEQIEATSVTSPRRQAKSGGNKFDYSGQVAVRQRLPVDDAGHDVVGELTDVAAERVRTGAERRTVYAVVLEEGAVWRYVNLIVERWCGGLRSVNIECEWL